MKYHYVWTSLNGAYTGMNYDVIFAAILPGV